MLPKNIVQPLPTEIQELIAIQEAIIAQCDGELLSLRRATENWTARKAAAQDRVKSLSAKYGKPDLAVWPAEVEVAIL